MKRKKTLEEIFAESRTRKEKERLELKHMKELLTKERKENKKRAEKKKRELELLWKKQSLVKL